MWCDSLLAKNMAWRVTHDRDDPHRRAGGTRREGRRLDGTGQRRAIRRPLTLGQRRRRALVYTVMRIVNIAVALLLVACVGVTARAQHMEISPRQSRPEGIEK